MSTKMTNLIALIVGGGIGSAITYFCVKSKYDNLINEAVEEVKQKYSEKIAGEEKVENNPEPVEEPEVKSKVNQNKPNITDYNNISINQGYTKKDEPKPNNDIQVITKDEFDNGEYNNAYLTYFADGVLINDLGDEEVEIDLIGRSSLDTFGDGEDPDIIYVRNNKYEIDYEITRVKDSFNVDEYTESDEEDTDYDD